MGTDRAKPSLSRRFLDGLMEHDLTLDEIVEQGWKYAGGDKGRHARYWALSTRGHRVQPPAKQRACVCGHHIKENCYIAPPDFKRVLVLGNCCIRKFIPKSTRTCGDCGAAHRNRVVNRCARCRQGKCDGCSRAIALRYKKCWRCQHGVVRGRGRVRAAVAV